MKNTIILYANAERDVGFEMTRRVEKMLSKLGRRVVICPMFADDKSLITKAELDQTLPHAEMIITFGGDGTILKAARVSAEYDVPILGVNMGSKGFMAELETEDIALIEQAARGEYGIDRRMMLDVELTRDGETVYTDFALNDVVISGANKVIDLTLFGNGQKISHFSGDGAVIATPTGSTAYSMAAGGPIVEPSAYNIIITPICAHVLEAKPFVLAPDRRVSVEIGHRKQNSAYMSVDGCGLVGVLHGDVVNVNRSEKFTQFVRVSNSSFYKKVSEKLGERS